MKKNLKRFSLSVAALTASAALVLTGCSSGTGTGEESSNSGGTASAEFPITVTDMSGEEVTIESADRVMVTDNRAFHILEAWGVTPVAAPVDLMDDNLSWTEDSSITNLGNHREPNLDEVVNADPDVIINGYRFGDHGEDIKKAAPDAAFVSLDENIGEDEKADTYEHLTKSTQLLGEIFNKQDEAQELVDNFDNAIADAQDAYDPDSTVLGIVAAGKDLNYSAPVEGRGAGDYFSLLDLTPALESDGSTNHQGDDISIEAMAQSNPDFLLVLDRAAAVSSEDGEDKSAKELITESPALQDVTAVKESGHIIYLPASYYLREDILQYTEVLEDMTETFKNAA
ncbi:MAG: siderophore ABC transporter substrate-binding protein [Canibacter sp.]